jgi:putative peptidoglycan lipid II flippase
MLLGANNAQADAFNASIRITNTVFEISLGAFVVSSFVPIFSEYIQNKDFKGAEKFSNTFLNIIIIITAIVSVLGVLFSTQVIAIFAQGFSGETQMIASNLLKILFPSVIFISVAYIMVGILQSLGKFIVPALISTFSNLAIIGYLIIFKMSYGITGIAIIFLIAWGLQVIVQIPSMAQKKYKYKLHIDFKNEGLRKLIRLAPSVLVSTSYQPVMGLINLAFASSILGVTSVLEYSNTLYLVTIGLMISAVTNVLLPKLSRLSTANAHEEFSNILRKAFSAIIIIVTPVMTIVILYSNQIIRTLYWSDKFTEADISNVAPALSCYAIGMVAYAIIEISNKSFYAKKKKLVTIFAPFTALAIDVALIFIITRIYGISGWTLAISAGLATITLAIIMVFFVQRENKFIDKRLIFTFVKTVIAEAVTLAIVFGLSAVGAYSAISSKISSIFGRPVGPGTMIKIATATELAVFAGIFIVIYFFIILAFLKFKIKKLI